MSRKRIISTKKIVCIPDRQVELTTRRQRTRLTRDLDEIDANGQFVPWEKAKKELGL